MRLAGITIPDKKRLEIGLTAIFGIGRPRAHKILLTSGIPYGRKSGELSASEENKIRKAVEIYKIEGDLKREIGGNIKRLKDIACYRGIRHTRKLPVRGQRTKTNQRTAKGNVRKTMGSGRTKVEKK